MSCLLQAHASCDPTHPEFAGGATVETLSLLNRQFFYAEALVPRILFRKIFKANAGKVDQ